MRGEYRPDIDGLRALAVWAVALYHAFPRQVYSGFVGVDIFFVISGYLIGGIILRDIYGGTFSFLNFYSRRIRRIFPSLLLTLCAVLIVGAMALFPDEFSALGRYAFGGAFFVSNFFLWQDAGYFDDLSRAKPLLHLWSLGIEEQFYVLFPFFLYVCAKEFRNIRLFVLGVCLVSFIANIYYMQDRTADFYNPLTRAWELFAGAALATSKATASIETNEVMYNWVNNGIKYWRGIGLALLGCVLLGAAFLYARNDNAHPGLQAVLPVLGTVACIASESNVFSKIILANQLVVYIGRVSYPFYLWHWVLLSFGYIIHGGWGPNSWQLRIGLIVISFLLAIFTYEFWEKPIRFCYKSQHTVIWLCGGMIAVGLVGITVFFNSGFPQRGEFSKYTAVLEQMDKSSLTNSEEEVAYAGISVERFQCCRYTDIHAKDTVALIGDSHALAAYKGVAKLGYEIGYNTVVLTYAVPAGAFMGETYKNHSVQMPAIFEALIKKMTLQRCFGVCKEVRNFRFSKERWKIKKRLHLCLLVRCNIILTC